MIRLSSNLTLFLKIFLPTAWATFFGMFTLAVFFFTDDTNPLFSNWTFKLGVLVTYLLFLSLIYFTIFQLKRVETDGEFFYVTNYFKTIRIPFDSVEKITQSSIILGKVGSIRLHAKGNFGRKIKFIIKPATFNPFLQSNPNMDATNIN